MLSLPPGTARRLISTENLSFFHRFFFLSVFHMVDIVFAASFCVSFDGLFLLLRLSSVFFSSLLSREISNSMTENLDR